MKSKGALSIDIGNTKTHAQVRGVHHELLDEWTMRTKHHRSLSEVIEQGFLRSKEVLGGKPDVVGLGFGGPVDPDTGAVKLAFVPEFTDDVTRASVQVLVENTPVVHLNDVAAAAHYLVSPYFTPNYTMLTAEPVMAEGPAVLVEIGTGVGTAYCFPDGAVKPSEAHRSHASNGTPFGHNLSGDQGFIRLLQRVREQVTEPPKELQDALDQKEAAGPTITALIARQSQDRFTQTALKTYASYLGEYLGVLQLSFLATAIYIGGSVGRAPGFLERIIAEDAFWEAFAKEDSLRGRDMPILRVDDKDATVKGVYTAALRWLEEQSEPHAHESVEARID